MSAQPVKTDDQAAIVGQQTEIIEAKFEVTKYVATFSGKKTTSADGEHMPIQGSGDLHSELVDSAISRICVNLPAEVMRVTQLQRHQGSNISSLQAQLAHLQEQKKKALTRSAEMREEIERIRRQTYLLEAECSRKNRRCVQLKDEIMASVKDGETKGRLLTTRTTELQALKKQLEKYRERLDEYSDSVASTDTGNSKVQADIRQVENRLATLREKRDFLKENPEKAERICGGSAERELKDKVTQLVTETDHLQEEVKQLQEKVETIRAKQEQVKQATAVLKKRNAAQLLRLKRQVKEQHLRHRQWTEQSRLLKQNVTTLTQRLHTA